MPFDNLQDALMLLKFGGLGMPDTVNFGQIDNSIMSRGLQ
ncbi:MAG: hypothetical protein QG635_1114, partial [Bacteroidota bacterium]|nr:hypothetical protein [Bacteroidota bacterium]